MELADGSIAAETKHLGNEIFDIPAGDWVQIRHGDPNDPVEVLEEQVPVGKAWNVHIQVTITETDI